MFEKFTENAINAVTQAQEQAKSMHNAYVQPEHLLLGICKQAKGISLRLFKNSNITFEDIEKEVKTRLRFEKSDKAVKNIPFSDESKTLLKNALDLANKSSSNTILFEHLFLSVINDKLSYNKRILEQFDFDIKNAKEILLKLVEKKSKRLSHPEIEENKEPDLPYLTADFVSEGSESSKVFKKAMSKLLSLNYENLGTEQIIAAILEGDSELSKILNKNGITSEIFGEKLSQHTSRQAEYGEKQLVLTPSAFSAMNLALQTAREVGSSEITPEHIILGVLKAKKGIAYEIFKSLNISDDNLAHNVLKPIEKQMPETLTILRLAKQEARRLGRNVVGTEMFLLGIISEGNGIGFKVLNDLELTLKDIRQVVEKLLGYGNEYNDKEVVFTKRAKKILEVAWKKANKYKKPRIMSEHLLYAITTEPTSVAMKALGQLGVDAVEIRQGILREVRS